MFTPDHPASNRSVIPINLHLAQHSTASTPTTMAMDWFWSDWFWMLPGLTWDDYKPVEGISTPDSADLWFWPFVLMVAFLIFRNLILIPWVLSPIGQRLGVRSKPCKPPTPNNTLEELYKVNRAKPPHKELERYAAKMGMTVRQVQRWLRRKLLSQQKTSLTKFNDFGWQFVYYTIYCIFGLVVVASQSWCYDIEQAMENYPRTSISQGLRWYILTTYGFYLAQTYLLFTENRSYDFNRMLLHHACIFALIVFSWIGNVVRLAGIAFLIHECVEIPFAVGKMFFYSGKTRVYDFSYIPYCSIWFITRLVIYPFHILRGSLFIAPGMIGGTCPAYYLLNALMLVMLCFHVMWTIDIFKAGWTCLVHRSTLDDRCSSDENSDGEVPLRVPNDTDKTLMCIQPWRIKSNV